MQTQQLDWGNFVRYLNSSGSRWKYTTERGMHFVLRMPDGTHTIRKADYYESLGNFATINFRRNGVRLAAFPDDIDRIEGLAVVDLARCRTIPAQ
jgi:hypothetical protein